MLPYLRPAEAGREGVRPSPAAGLVNAVGSDLALTGRERVRAQQDAKPRFLCGSEADHAIRDRLLTLAGPRGRPSGRLALAWLRARPHVT